MKVPAAGADLYYTVRGSGPLCLVLSGIGTGPYERMSPPALSAWFTLAFVDLRGSGRSTGDPADLTFDRLAEDLEAVRSDLDVPQVAVLGHSILGMLAIEYGRRKPGRVSHVIVAGTPPFGDLVRVSTTAAAFFEADASEDRKAVLRENHAHLPPDASVMDAMLADTPKRFFDPRFDAAPLFAGRVARPALLTHVMTTLGPRWDVSEGRDSLRVPLFVAHGRYDYVVPWTLWRDVAERLPDATLRLFEESGHQPFFEEPLRFAAELVAWMIR